MLKYHFWEKDIDPDVAAQKRDLAAIAQLDDPKEEEKVSRKSWEGSSNWPSTAFLIACGNKFKYSKWSVGQLGLGTAHRFET